VAALLIGWHDLTLVFRERQVVFWVFVAPLIFTTFFGLMYRERAPRPIEVALVNRDSTEQVARGLAQVLERERIVVRRVGQVVPGALTAEVPAGADATLATGTAPGIVLHAGAEESSAERTARFTLQKALLTMALLGADGAAAPPGGPVAIAPDDLGVRRVRTTSGFQRSVPAYLVMFLFMNLLVSGAGLSAERASGRLRRLMMAPVSRTEVMAGKLLSRLGVAVVQVAYMLALGVVVYRITWAEHTWVFAAFLFLVSLAAAAMGLLLGTLFDDPDKCVSVAVWSVIVLSPLGGLWWPLELVGPRMRQVAYIVPTGWAMEGVNAMLAFGAGWPEVWPFAAAFVALFAVSLTVAARRLKA